MTRRSERVAEALRRLASEIVHSELKDPRLKGVITVTRVTVTADLRSAKLYYSVLGDDKKKKLVARGLKSAKNFVRKRLADELKLRYATDISFIFDERFAYTERMNEIFNKLHREENNERFKSDNGKD
ncbi:MAG: 30S ribosome-binding factor RbfA [Candidatus Omnitrophica bacterium]|nr:30S ribosome-binding factor RbfA [Candidatus Omnitrophota bacterium]